MHNISSRQAGKSTERFGCPLQPCRIRGASIALWMRGRFAANWEANVWLSSQGSRSWRVTPSKANVILFIIHDKPAGDPFIISKPDVALSIKHDQCTAVGGDVD